MNITSDVASQPNGPAALDIQDYLDATSDASKRTRWAVTVLVISCVLGLIAYVNGLPNNWGLQRLQAMARSDSARGRHLNDSALTFGLRDSAEISQKQFDARYQALLKTYIETSTIVRIPFFGVAFDVNYLGLFGGISFLSILLYLRFCISREVDNLRISFLEAERLHSLEPFYTLLSMRQVITVPHSRTRRVSPALSLAPKLLCVIPLLLYIAIMFNDFRTEEKGNSINADHTNTLLAQEVVFVALILMVTLSVLIRWWRIDHIWLAYWVRVQQVSAPRSYQAHLTTDDMPGIAGRVIIDHLRFTFVPETAFPVRMVRCAQSPDSALCDNYSSHASSDELKDLEKMWCDIFGETNRSTHVRARFRHAKFRLINRSEHLHYRVANAVQELLASRPIDGGYDRLIQRIRNLNDQREKHADSSGLHNAPLIGSIWSVRCSDITIDKVYPKGHVAFSFEGRSYRMHFQGRRFGIRRAMRENGFAEWVV
jgi:hypothetical protein